MRKIVQIGLLASLLLCLITCRKDNRCNDPTNPKCSNYNPCSLVHPLSAAFSIYENDCTQGPGEYDTSWHYYPTDTVRTNCVSFTASDSTADSVRWTIGAGSYTARSFQLNFQNNRPASVPITLTVYKHRNSCYPADDTVKTLTKTLYFTDTCLAYGIYSGYFDNNPADTGTISIRKIPVYVVGTGLSSGIALSGFAIACVDTLSPAYGFFEQFFTSLSFSATGNTTFCTWIYGSLYYNRENETVLIQYAETYRKAHNFNGHKIN
jgi:hypothetical protein